MTFNSGAQLDPSQVQDARGGGGFGRRTIAAGGGGIGLVVALIYALLGGGLGTTTSVGGSDLNPQSSALAESCKTGADANAKEDCRILGYVNSVQSFWTTELPALGATYVPAQTVFFTGETSTGCGLASTEVGPFYCPPDQLVYIDLGFLDELKTKFGATGGPAAQAYVIAHEYGHRVQDLLGLLTGDTSQQGASGQSVRTELQADCYAGVWAAHAADTGFLESLTKANITDALNAAAAVGDDRIQSEYQGQVTPESWTHGSSVQRDRWFSTGYETGDPAQCDTFSGPI
jgi:predicted metalloprotease